MIAPFDLTGRVAIVTGAATGIGRAIATGLAEHGASVVIGDLDRAAAEATAAELRSGCLSVAAVEADVRRPDGADRLVDAAASTFGPVDILVNNAGGSVGDDVPSEVLPLEQWQDTFALTVTSMFLCARSAGRVMVPRGEGRIVNVASIYGLVGHDPSLYDRRRDGEPLEQLAYVAAKGAVISLTRGLAVYWARHNIRVNAIAPGHVRTERNRATVSAGTWDRLTERTPLKRPGQPRDIGGAAVFLASAAADFVTGQTLVVDGGWCAW